MEFYTEEAEKSQAETQSEIDLELESLFEKHRDELLTVEEEIAICEETFALINNPFEPRRPAVSLQDKLIEISPRASRVRGPEM